MREKENEEVGGVKKEDVKQLIEQQFNINGGVQIIVQRGATPVIHIHADKDERAIEEEVEASIEVVELSKEDEELLLPVFKGSRENLRQFFAEVQGITPQQVAAKVNAWIGDGRICNEQNMKNLWRVLNNKKIYTLTYQAWNHIVRS